MIKGWPRWGSNFNNDNIWDATAVSSKPVSMQMIQGGQKEPCTLSSGSHAESGNARKIMKPMDEDRDILLSIQ
ncbi:hypothetical protein ANRL1_03543 [Anaerolineae bacterium]|nr:hypothetical protein ANRL1_03543 [Anaerolineae bacterium]